MSGIRGLVRKISITGKGNPLIIEADELKWKEERENLLISRITPLENEYSLFPPRKTEDIIGPPVPIPPMSAIRLSSLVWQTCRVEGTDYALSPEIELFCQTFCKGQEHRCIKENNNRAYDEAIAYGSETVNGLQTKMVLIDWELLPNDVDCVFIGVLLPKNSAKLLRGDNWFSATGMLELLPLDDIDEDNWMRTINSWPKWEKDSPVKASLAQKDMFKKEPEFFLKNSIYSTYLCAEEMGYTQAYLWGKCYRDDGNWEFKGIREAVDSSSIDGCLATMKAYLPSFYNNLGTFDNCKLLLATQDPLAKLSISCIRFDRFGYRVGDIVKIDQQKRGSLEVNLHELIQEHTTSLWIIWTGHSDTFINMKYGDIDPTEFMGSEHCILLQFTSLGVGNPYLFPPPKPKKWIGVPQFRALDNIDPEIIIEEYQPKAKTIHIHIENGCDLAPKSWSCSPFTHITFGDKSSKTSIQKKTKNPVWSYDIEWDVTSEWRNNPTIEFQVYSRSKVKGRAPIGMAVYELEYMRIPFSGPLRLRPAGINATKEVGGHIVVVIDVLAKIETKKEEPELEIQ